MGESSRLRRSAPRVLILDDQRSVRRAFQLMLIDEGFTVDVAASTGAALEQLERRAYEVLLLDTAMAGSERRELLDRLRHDHASVAVVVATGEPSALWAAAEHANVDTVLAKPVPREQLVAAVGEAVRKRLQRSGTRLRRLREL